MTRETIHGLRGRNCRGSIELTDLQAAASSAQIPGYTGYRRTRPGKFPFTKLV
jgi:hypothetical protein